MTYSDLVKNYNDPNLIPYHELLQTEEWFEKRNTIIKRDHQLCTNCNCSETFFGREDYIIRNVKTQTQQEKELGTFDILEIPTDKFYTLHAHHKLYILHRLPWEYNDEDIVTLCNECHEEFHKNNTVPCYTDDGANELNYIPCKRCNGMGWFPQYKNVQNGVCFRCKGACYEELI